MDLRGQWSGRIVDHTSWMYRMVAQPAGSFSSELSRKLLLFELDFVWLDEIRIWFYDTMVRSQIFLQAGFFVGVHYLFFVFVFCRLVCTYARIVCPDAPTLHASHVYLTSYYSHSPDHRHIHHVIELIGLVLLRPRAFGNVLQCRITGGGHVRRRLPTRICIRHRILTVSQPRRSRITHTKRSILTVPCCHSRSRDALAREQSFR